MWLYSQVRSLGDIPRHYARHAPDRVALIGPNRRLTYAELDERSNRVANLLRGEGVQPGDRVAFLGKNSVEHFEIFFGASKAGMTLVPINWRLAPPEIEAILQDATPALLVVDREFEAVATALNGTDGRWRLIFFDQAEADASELGQAIAAADPDDRAIDVDPWSSASLMYTSGTTGAPKGVQCSHSGYLGLRLIEHLEPGFEYYRDDIMLMVMPLFHAMGSVLSFLALYHGSALVVDHMPEPGELIRMIERERPTVLPFVPTVVQMVVDHPSAARADFSSVRVNLYGGSPIAHEVLVRAIETMGCAFIQLYGGTETGGPVTLLRPDEHQLDCPDILRSCGKPFPLVEIRIADPEGNALASGEVGEVLVKTPGMMTGYYGQPDLTRQAFHDGWYRTGDGGYKDEQGYLYIVDRIKDMIISGGENVYSVEVEQVLMRIEGVIKCAVVGMPDPKWGEAVVAALVVDPAFPISAEDVIRHCRASIASFKVPKRVEFLTALPVTPVGKVRKPILKEQLAALAAAKHETVPVHAGGVVVG